MTLDPDVFTLDRVQKRFGGERAYLALDDVNLRIREGEFVCLLGASGCGKSTLLNLLAGFESPTGGQLLFRGLPVRGPGKERVLLFQDSGAALLPWLTAMRNVEFGMKLQKIPIAEREYRGRECLGMVGLAAHSDKYPHEMSGGMRQRLQIARALAVEPDVLLMDEPFGALDAITRKRMHEVLLHLWEKMRKTIVFVTHDILEAITLADRIVLMNVGPGSRAKTIFDVTIERPRDPADPRIGQLFSVIEQALYDGGSSGEPGRSTAV